MKLKNILARCIVKILSGSEYSFTALSGEYITSTEHLQEFGFASRKPSGTDANGIAVFYGGDRGNASLLVLEVPSLKPSLNDGESALFNAYDAIVKLRNDGVAELNGSSNLGLVKIQELTDKLNALKAELDAHIHSGGTIAGFTGAPTAPVTAFVKDDYENTKVVH